MTTIRVKSLMVPPGIPDVYSRSRLVDAGIVKVFGRAWSGSGIGIEKVEVAINGQWQEADLHSDLGQYAWRGWTCDWQATPGEHELMCRATDANGDVQPIAQRFDMAGFGNNAVQRLPMTVR